jgi:hypothetical protein
VSYRIGAGVGLILCPALTPAALAVLCVALVLGLMLGRGGGAGDSRRVGRVLVGRVRVTLDMLGISLAFLVPRLRAGRDAPVGPALRMARACSGWNRDEQQQGAQHAGGHPACRRGFSLC